jgi:thymidylate synthase
MKQYVDLITTILKEGRVKTDRTGTGTISIFGHQSVYYMKDGFPLLTMKKTYPKGVFEELFWFLKGDTNIRSLNQKNVHIWDEWPYAKYKKYTESLEEPDFRVHVDDPQNNCTRIMTQEEFSKAIVDDEEFAKRWGDLGPVYGKQWVNWGGHYVELDGERAITKGINQIQNVIDRLKNVPDCRRLIVSAWNVNEIPQMALAPCHALFQFISEPLTIKERAQIAKEKGYPYNNGEIADEKWMDEANIPRFRLSLQLYQRSADTFLGVPFNIASYALLLHMVAQVVNMVPYKFVHTLGDAHLYLNHKEQINEFLHRTHVNEEVEKYDYWEHLTKHDSYFTQQTNPDAEYNGTHYGIGNHYGPSLPKIKLNTEIKNIFDFTIDDVELIDYNPLPAIKAPVAV